MTTTPLGLLSSFRKSITPRSGGGGGGGGGGDSSDDDDGGWVHGGKYCPAKNTSHQQPTSATPNTNDDNNAMPSPYSMLSPAALDTPLPQESMAAASQQQTQTRANINTSQRTPLTIQLQRMLQATPSLQTPTNNNITTPPNYSQQQHTPLHPPPTPIQHFLQSSGVTPSASHIIGNIILTNLFTIVYNVTIIIWSSISNFIMNFINSQFPNLTWDIVPDIIHSLYETIIELYQLLCLAIKFISPFVLWIIQTSIALVLTIVGTLLWGIVLLFKGLSGGNSSKKEQTSRNGNMMVSIVGNVQTSAVKSLKENVLNSPFVKKFSGNDYGDGRLPFDGFTKSNVQNQVNVPRNNNNGVLASSLGNIVSNNTNATVSNNAPTSTNNRPTTSAMRRNSLLKQAQTPHTNNTSSGSRGTATPSTANTRRVLFSETDSGEVSTEQFMFDKHLPASARKDRPRNGNEGENSGRLSGETTSHVSESVGGATVQQQQSQQSVAENTPPREEVVNGGSVASQPSSNNASISADRNTASSVPKGQQQGAQAPQTSSTTEATAKKRTEEERLQDEEIQKQQYIERFGLLPTITPLSKRYGRMKRQQQQQQRGQKALPSSESATNRNDAASTTNAATSSSTTSTSTAASGSTTSSRSIKRKRRGDLLGAASRLGRHRRSRLNNGTQSSSLPTVLLRNRTPKRRREDDTKMNRTDEWVWKAMNRTDEKENRLNEDEEQEGNVAKRGKFSITKSDDDGNNTNTNSDNVVVGTPPKNPTASSTLPSVMTPPKTPGPSKFSLGALGSATPAPKKLNGSANTDTNDDDDDDDASSKPSIPFTFGETNNDDKSAAPSTATKKDSAPVFSFGSTATTATSSTGTEKNKETAPPTMAAFSFGTAATTTSSVETEKKNDTASTSATKSVFSFSASSAPSTVSEAKKVDDTSGQVAFSFGQTAAGPATTEQAKPSEASTVAQTSTFAFGASQPTPAASQPAQSSGASFSFGKTTPSTAAPTTAPFTFGQTTPAEQTKQSDTPAAQTSTFAFGGAQPTTTQPAPSSTGAAFSFGTSSAPVAPSVANPPTFAFGAASATGGTPAPPNFGQAQTTNSTFSLGGGTTISSGGASSRRRALKGRRK